ncbi:MAG: phosphoenolpyruvate carboxykinase (ATP) [Planctomycetota bacterium]
MGSYGYSASRFGIDQQGLRETGDVFWNLPPAELYEHSLKAGIGSLSSVGALVCTTGAHTGRSPNDKYFVEESSTKDDIDWGKVNQPISAAHFDSLHQRMIAHFKGRDVYVRDMFAGADESTRIAIRVVNETAWHNLFAAQLFIRPETGSTEEHDPQFTILNAPSCKADPEKDGTRSEVFVAISFAKKLILIGGTAYAGEIKKSIFTLMNYLLPKAGVLSMHCSANVGDNEVALFFGLSGTGKTTLSADPGRRLIGDDEHGWCDSGVFNIEGGCYAKCIRLSPEGEPQIYNAIRFGSVLENVVMDTRSRLINYESAELTENTRVAYPVDYIEKAVIPGVGGHPSHVLFLTCDAFGVLPPISRLTPSQAMYHFLSGYTAKVAGTEAGVVEPQVTFSACFGAPFLPLPPRVYAQMLGERLARHNVQCWLVNTGWSGGGVGVGERMKLAHTRAMVRSALKGDLNDVTYHEDPVFGVSVPESCPGVPSEVLTPRTAWSDGQLYDTRARELATRFSENFRKFPKASDEIRNAGPRALVG